MFKLQLELIRQQAPLPLSSSAIVSPPVFVVCAFMEVLGRVMMNDEKRPVLISGIVERS